MIYFTSDHHFFHSNIIDYCGRPFKNVENMNKTMAIRWNQVVKPNDVVYHLGDFALAKKDDDISFFYDLNGDIILIKGNHDRHIKRFKDRFVFVTNQQQIIYKNHNFFMSHRCVTTTYWDSGTIYLHGHRHVGDKWNKNVHGDTNKINVCVDLWDFYPINIDTILRMVK